MRRSPKCPTCGGRAIAGKSGARCVPCDNPVEYCMCKASKKVRR